MFTEIFIIIVLLLVLLMLISFTMGGKKKNDKAAPIPVYEQETKPCPICKKALTPGERVHSVVFKEGDDRLMNIYGCSYCYNKHPAGASSQLRERFCPSCKLKLPQGSYAIARVFERQHKKTHIHVLGCPTCRKRKDWI